MSGWLQGKQWTNALWQLWMTHCVWSPKDIIPTVYCLSHNSTNTSSWKAILHSLGKLDVLSHDSTVQKMQAVMWEMLSNVTRTQSNLQSSCLTCFFFKGSKQRQMSLCSNWWWVINGKKKTVELPLSAAVLHTGALTSENQVNWKSNSQHRELLSPNAIPALGLARKRSLVGMSAVLFLLSTSTALCLMSGYAFICINIVKTYAKRAKYLLLWHLVLHSIATCFCPFW